MAAAPLLCPQCKTPYEEGDFLCASCELILDLDAAEANYKLKKPSIVQALLSPPQRRTGMRPAIPAALKKKGDPEITVRAAVVMDDSTVPRLVAGMNLALTPLHEFEAMVASFVDGASTVPQIAAAAEISRVEAMAVFTSLAERQVIELRREEPPKPPPSVASKAERPEPATLPPNVIELPPELPAEPPTPPPDTPLPPAVDEAPPPPPARTRTPMPSDLVGRRATLPPSPPRPPPVMTPSRTPASPPAPPPAPPSRGAPVPTPVSTARPKASQLQDASMGVSAPKAESVLERAISLERRGEVDGAIHVLKRAITQVKEPAALCNKLALILVNQRKDFKQAEELLNKAIELEPENPVYQQNLFKIVGMAAERRESRGGPSSSSKGGGGGFLSKLLKK